MRFDPVGIWEARLRDAPAASAAEAILTALLGYRDSHLLHADDVAQLASALEAWGTLVLEGARPDGSPYVPPSEGERASAFASLVARGYANRIPRFVITNESRMLNWSNHDGWVAVGYDYFTQQERDTLALPIGGQWVAVELPPAEYQHSGVPDA